MAMTTVAPERSYKQRMAALQRANAIRTRRAELKRDAKAGRVDLLEVLAAPPAEVETMKVFDLLLARPGFGRVKVNKILSKAQVSPSKTVGGLSDRQRRELVGRISHRAW